MKFDPEKHHRRSIRLKGYDYAQAGAYFVTICTQNRECLFGKVVDGGMWLNDAGQMVAIAWQQLPQRFPQVAIDAFVVMPNHLHGIIIITKLSDVGAGLVPAPLDEAKASTGLGNIVGAFKSITTHEYTIGVRQRNWLPFSGKLWQRNYYENIIRDQRALNNIRQYIAENPLKWSSNAENIGKSLNKIYPPG